MLTIPTFLSNQKSIKMYSPYECKKWEGAIYSWYDKGHFGKKTLGGKQAPKNQFFSLTPIVCVHQEISNLK